MDEELLDAYSRAVIDVVERVQPGRQGMQHPELRDRAQLVFLDGSAHAVAGFDHPG